MTGIENEIREAMEDFEKEFDSEEFKQNMQEFGKTMKGLGEKIRESVENSVKHLSCDSPHIHRIKIFPRESVQDREEDVREYEKERAKVKAPLEKIEMLKELLDEGLITQEDFDLKKNKILDEI